MAWGTPVRRDRWIPGPKGGGNLRPVCLIVDHRPSPTIPLCGNEPGRPQLAALAAERTSHLSARPHRFFASRARLAITQPRPLGPHPTRATVPSLHALEKPCQIGPGSLTCGVFCGVFEARRTKYEGTTNTWLRNRSSGAEPGVAPQARRQDPDSDQPCAPLRIRAATARRLGQARRVPMSTMSSPSSLVNAASTPTGRSSRTSSDGRHSFVPSGVSTTGRFISTGCRPMKSSN